MKTAIASMFLVLEVVVAAKAHFVCPMHPEVVSDTPGLCPKCNMKLDPKPGATEVRHTHEGGQEASWL